MFYYYVSSSFSGNDKRLKNFYGVLKEHLIENHRNNDQIFNMVKSGRILRNQIKEKYYKMKWEKNGKRKQMKNFNLN